MKLTIRNHIFTRCVYNDTNRLLYIIKSHVLSTQKTVINACGEKIYETRINNLSAPQGCLNSAEYRQYAICKSGISEPCFATARLAYKTTADKSKSNHYFLNAPSVDKMMLYFTGTKKSIIARLLKDGTLKITDDERNVLGTIGQYRFFKGYQIDCNANIDGALVSALFILTRYLIKENEIVVV